MCLYFDTFYNNDGSALIVSMTNMDTVQFDTISSKTKEHLLLVCSVGEEMRCTVIAKDALFM